MDTKESKKLKVGNFLKMLLLKNNLTAQDVAEKLGKTRQGVSYILGSDRVNMGTLVEIMEICEEPLVLSLSTGELIELEITKKKSKNE